MKRWLKFSPKEVVVLIILTVVMLRIPSLFEPYWYGDEGIYLTLGMAVRRGLTLYRDIHDNKPPLIYLVAAVAGTQFWLKFILMVWHLTSVVVFYRLAKSLFEKHVWVPTLAAGFFSILTMLPEGNIANGEIFTILPVIGGMLLLVKSSIHSASSGPRYFFIGGLFSLGFLFKVPAVMDFVAATIFLVLLSSANFREISKKIFSRQAWLMAIGFAFPILLTMIYYGTRGAFEPYVRSALLQNFGYLQSWKTGAHSASGFATKSGLLTRTLILFITTLILWKVSVKSKLPHNLRLIAAWFLFALYGALLSERPYPHYLIQPAVPAALLIAVVLTQRRRIVRIGSFALFGLAAAAYLYVGFWSYPIWPYYQNFIEWTLGRKNQEAYFGFFGSQVLQAYRVSDYIRQTTLTSDKIFVWGDDPYIYALSNRLPAGRFTVAYHVLDFNAAEETAAAIQQQKPRVIVTIDSRLQEFPQLQAILAANYVKSNQFEKALIYRRIF